MTSQNPFLLLLWVADPKIITVQAVSDAQSNDLGKLGTERDERVLLPPPKGMRIHSLGGKVFVAQQRQSHV